MQIDNCNVRLVSLAKVNDIACVSSDASKFKVVTCPVKQA